ncbi:MAG TPA: DNRLRE domain-containing protein [Candidatus Atribacteria bacterium]|nr:DNRLRE domain-containing protein [Candidatus Atribacteria bacterium]
MKKALKRSKYYFILFNLVVLFILAGCDGTPIDSPIINSFSANVNTITKGESAILSWEITGASTTTISPDVGEVDSSGSRIVSPIETTTYTLTATNSSGSVIDTEMVTVNPDTEEEDFTIPVIHSFSSNSTWISTGESAFLDWEVSNANTVTIDPVIGEVNLSGSASVSPTEVTTYTLTASNNVGINTAEVTINIIIDPINGGGGNVILPPSIQSFSSDKSILTEGISATLSWEVSGIATITIEPGIGEVKPSSSSYNVSPTETTTYTLTATNIKGSDSETVTIVVPPKIIQPLPVEGKDTWVTRFRKDENYGYNEHLFIGRFDGDVERALLQFNVSDIPANAVIVSSDLQLYQYNTWGSLENFTIGAHRITSSWLLHTVTWNSKVSFDSSPVGTCEVLPSAGTWLSWDITSLLQGWVNGTISNYGVLLKKVNESSGGTDISCWTSRYTDNQNLRPKLEISYYVP